MRAQLDLPWTITTPLIALIALFALWVTGSDRSLFLALNHVGHAAGTDLWACLTILGDGAVSMILILPAIRRAPKQFWATLIAALLVAIVVQLCKRWGPSPRPLAVLPADTFFHDGPGLRAVSFPSGHSAAIFTLTGVWIISIRDHHLFKLLLIVLALMVSLSRIMVGVHWPLDILGGMLIGWGTALAGLAISHRTGWKTSGAGGLLAGGLLMTISVALLFSRHTGFEGTMPFQRLLGIACLASGFYEIYRMRGWNARLLPTKE